MVILQKRNGELVAVNPSHVARVAMTGGRDDSARLVMTDGVDFVVRGGFAEVVGKLRGEAVTSGELPIRSEVAA